MAAGFPFFGADFLVLTPTAGLSGVKPGVKRYLNIISPMLPCREAEITHYFGRRGSINADVPSAKIVFVTETGV